MPRLSDCTPEERARLESLDCPHFEDAAFVEPRPLASCRVALISSAGLMQRHGPNVHAAASDYRTLDDSIADDDILMNHVSVNFDRTAFAEDINTVLPRQRLRELAEQNIIEHAATEHYSFMGATAPELMEPHVHRLAEELKLKQINTVCLLPV